MLFKLTLMPDNTHVWISVNDPLTQVEYEPGGAGFIPFGCRAGACGACAIEVLDGLGSLGPQSPEEKEFLDLLGFVGERFRLACQCKVTGEATIRVAESTD